MIGRMLHGLPTRPVLIIVPVVMAAVIALYYSGKHAECTRNTELRERFHTAVENNIGGTLSLKDLLDSQWEYAAIKTGFKPENRATLPDCPFDWGWTRADREALVERGLLNIIAFTGKGRVIDYVEFRRDRIDFVALDNPYTPDNAVFEVSRAGRESDKLILRPAAGGE